MALDNLLTDCYRAAGARENAIRLTLRLGSMTPGYPRLASALRR